MTKFSEEFMTRVNDHWKENRGKPLGENIGGVHMERITIKKYGLDELAAEFNLTESQARRIVYVKMKGGSNGKTK
jgi:hypothetical protein